VGVRTQHRGAQILLMFVAAVACVPNGGTSNDVAIPPPVAPDMTARPEPGPGVNDAAMIVDGGRNADATAPGREDNRPPPQVAHDAETTTVDAPRDAGAVSIGGGFASTAVSGYQLLVRPRAADGSVGAAVPFDIRGISWSPAQRGARQPDGADYLAAADRDLPLMRAAGINVVKSYGPLSRAVLDKLLANGIAAIVSVLITAGDDVEGPVKELRDHPALLMWIIGNEWNLNRLFDTCALDGCYQKVDEAARRIKALDPNHAVATSFAPAGEVPSDGDLMRLSAIDVWGLNVYSQPGFFNRFQSWRLAGLRTGIKKPMFMSEYGADAYDNRQGRPDEAAQATALRQQTSEIRAQLSARNPALPCLGGTPFEWNDEWWKHGNPNAQDSGGFVHDGVAADGFANEEWWGGVAVDRAPRPAYEVLKELYAR
jgi:hypothetical protein